jgi:hypothetical protein
VPDRGARLLGFLIFQSFGNVLTSHSVKLPENLSGCLYSQIRRDYRVLIDYL